jgi:carbonic anhydrase/acetyltransferase-like protein (isoleucine patch superfamily)
MDFEQYKDMTPKIPQTAKIFANATLAGDITVGEYVNIWFNASLRGDMAPITIGHHTNIQDNAVVHTNTDMPTYIGANCTIGHGAIIHACTIGDNCLVGMGSIILDGAVVEDNALVGAGTLVPPGKTVPSGSLVVGNPMRVVRQLTKEEIQAISINKDHYIALMKDYT